MNNDKRNLILKARGVNLRNGVYKPHTVNVNKSHNELIDTVFAVDPSTGFPSSDLSVMNNPNTSASIKQAIEHLQSPLNRSYLGLDDDDVVIDTVQGVNESDIDYAERMNKYVEETKKKLK